MGVNPLDLAGDLVLILVAAFLAGAAARRLGLPLVLGYIVAGIVVGPHTPGPTVVRREDIEILADVGVALLLLAVGLELPFHQLAPVRRVALLGGTMQIILTMALGGLAASLLGLAGPPALWLGACLALSSTAVVLKTLQEQGTVQTLAARVMIGLLLVQDLAVIPLLVLLPGLASGSQGWGNLAVAGLRAGALVALMVILGTRVFPAVLERIAHWRSRELFLVATVAAGLGVGYGAYLLGLPFAFGAFLAGMVLSESEYSRQALHDIEPLRDVFVMLFFVSVGMLLEPGALVRAGGLVAMLIALLAGKALLVGGLVRGFGYGAGIPLLTGMGLFQIGEFSFVLARSGAEAGLVSPDLYAAVLTVAAVSMAATPAVIQAGTRLAGRLAAVAPRSALEPNPDRRRRPPVIVAGYGRLGRYVSQVLQELGHPVVVIDLDPGAVAAARRAGCETVYGNAAAPAVLQAAAVRDASLIILTIPDPVAAPVAAELARRLNPTAPVIVRAVGPRELEQLHRLGVDDAVLPELEAALEIVRQTLVHLEMEPGDIQRFVDRLRREHYAPLLTGAEDADLLSLLRHTARIIEVEWCPIPAASALNGLTIGTARVRERTGASVVAVVRGEQVIPNPGPDVVLQAGDTVGIIGTRDQRRAFRALARAPVEAGS